MPQSRMMWLAFILLATVPLLWPVTPPLTDLPSHVARYRVMLDGGHVATLAHAYRFEWHLVGNLGVDLLILPLSRLFGLEVGVKLIVMLIPALTVAGLLWLTKEAHGEVPPTALFAIPLAYSFPFQFGFVNFCLSMGVALAMLALWVRLGRQGRLVFRAALFAPLTVILWICHMVGWGVFGLSAFAVDTARRRGAGENWRAAVGRSVLASLPNAVPLLMIAFAYSHGDTRDMLNWQQKLLYIVSAVRERWIALDLAAVAVMIAVLALPLVAPNVRYRPLLAWPALLCCVAYILMPGYTNGAGFADMRLLPFTLILALAALYVRPEGRRIATALTVAGAVFVGVRLAATTASFAMFDRSYRREAAAVAYIPLGAPTLALVRRPRRTWSPPRLDHLPALATVRRDAFVNTQWRVEGALLLTVTQPGVGAFAVDPSQLIESEAAFDGAIASFNRDAFDYVWTIGFPPGRARAGDLRLVWSNAGSALYQVVHTARSS